MKQDNNKTHDQRMETIYSIETQLTEMLDQERDVIN